MKKLIITLAIMGLLFVFCCPKPKAELVAGGAGQYYLSGGDIKQAGGGWTALLGNQINSHWIVWGKRIEYHADEFNVVNGDVGVSLLTDQIISKLRMGIYTNFGVGAGQVSGDPISFSALAGIGAFWQVSSVTKFLLGIDWSNTGNFNTSAIRAGMTVNLIGATGIAEKRGKKK